MDAVKVAKTRFITNLILSELPPNRAETFMARLHAQLPKESIEINEVLNKVHEYLHNAAKDYADYLKI